MFKPNLIERLVRWFYPEYCCKVDLVPHDYWYRNGGDNYPSHFYQYTCWKCNEKFGI